MAISFLLLHEKNGYGALWSSMKRETLPMSIHNICFRGYLRENRYINKIESIIVLILLPISLNAGRAHLLSTHIKCFG